MTTIQILTLLSPILASLIAIVAIFITVKLKFAKDEKSFKGEIKQAFLNVIVIGVGLFQAYCVFTFFTSDKPMTKYSICMLLISCAALYNTFIFWALGTILDRHNELFRRLLNVVQDLGNRQDAISKEQAAINSFLVKDVTTIKSREGEKPSVTPT